MEHLEFEKDIGIPADIMVLDRHSFRQNCDLAREAMSSVNEVIVALDRFLATVKHKKMPHDIGQVVPVRAPAAPVSALSMVCMRAAPSVMTASVPRVAPWLRVVPWRPRRALRKSRCIFIFTRMAARAPLRLARMLRESTLLSKLSPTS